MCTLTLAWQVLDDAAVAVAANRDEALERPAEPPGIYREAPRVIAPRDAEAGGTWIGVNEYGVVAGVTNRWLDLDTDLAGERSRGLLVGDALECESVREAIEVVERTTGELEYDGFNLVLADADDAVCLEWDGELTVTRFDPGVHVVVNVGFVGSDERFSIPDSRPTAGARQAENARRVRGALAVESTGTDDERSSAWLERAGAVLGDHEYGVCVHGDGFGTRSSSLLSVGRSGPTVDAEPESESELGSKPESESKSESTSITYAYADGPPCRTPYETVGVEGHI